MQMLEILVKFNKITFVASRDKRYTGLIQQPIQWLIAKVWNSGTTQIRMHSIYVSIAIYFQTNDTQMDAFDMYNISKNPLLQKEHRTWIQYEFLCLHLMVSFKMRKVVQVAPRAKNIH